MIRDESEEYGFILINLNLFRIGWDNDEVCGGILDFGWLRVLDVMIENSFGGGKRIFFYVKLID